MTVTFSEQHRLDLELVVGIVLIPEFSLKKKKKGQLELSYLFLKSMLTSW